MGGQKSRSYDFHRTRIADRTAGGTQILRKHEIVHIDVDLLSRPCGTTYLVRDERDPRQMNENQTKNTDTMETLKGMRTEESYLTGSLVNPKKAIRLLSDKLSDTAIMVADVGQNQFWGARHFEDLPGRKFMTSGGMGTMGYGIPAAVGAKIAAPDRQVVAVTGDGGFR